MSESENLETLSDVVARRVVLWRKRRNLTREALAERCVQLGSKITGPALANIETGRRNTDGQRRREVTIDEIMVLAHVLQISPVLLVAPVGEESTVPLLPGKPADTWTAARWISGEGERIEGDETWRVPLVLFRRHDQLLGDYDYEYNFEQIFGGTEDGEADAGRSDRIAALLLQLRDVRGEMLRHSLTPPPLPDPLKHVDDRRHVYFTPEEAERHIAAHPGDMRPVDHGRPGYGRPTRPGEPTAIRAAQISAGADQQDPVPDSEENPA